jgi:uncharacterized protein YjbI with pentapeptide repeats
MLHPRRLPMRITRRTTALSVLTLLAIVTAIGRYHTQQAGLTVDWPAVQFGLLAAQRWLWRADPLWPLLAVLAIGWRTSRHGRQWWTRHARHARAGLAIGVVAVLLVRFNPPRPVLLAAAGVGVVGLLGAWVLVLPRRLAPPLPAAELADLPSKDRLELTDSRLKLQNDLRTTALQAIAGLAVLAGALLAFQQLTDDRQQATATRELTRQGQASERFTRAVDQLGNPRHEARLGGIYALEQIARQAPDNRLPVLEVLVAYVRRRAPAALHQPRRGDLVEELRLRAPDVQAALTVLGRRDVGADDPPLDLHRLDLRKADLRDANLDSADLGGANLGEASLTGADLHRANLDSAHLHRADLHSAHLDSADLHSADLHGADLHSADLHSADLHSADLHGAHLVEAQLVGASLDVAHLVKTNLDRADLRGAELVGARLAGTHLVGGDLRDANLRGAELVGARLAVADLRDANLHDAYLDSVDLYNANLAGANLAGANLRHMDLRHAHLIGAQLRNAIASADTRWPPDFKPAVAGVFLRP